MTQLTLVMTVFNGERFLAAALESLLAQSMRDFDVIVVNDGSTDDSERILTEYARRRGRMQIIHQPNAGIVDSANRACGLVKTPYIARMDADDTSMPDRLQRQLDFLRRRPEVALLGGAAEFVNDSGDVVSTVQVPTRHEEIAAMLPERNAFVHSAVVVRRDAFLAVGGYRRAFSNTASDYDLWLRIAERYEVANLADVLVQYRVHPGQTTTASLTKLTWAAMGARLSAELRRAGQPDPFAAMTDAVSRDTLRRLGVTAAEIDQEEARAARSWARVMGEAGYHDTAVALARAAWRTGGGRVVTRDDVGRHYLAAARESLARRRVIPGLLAVARAVWWQPAMLGRVVWAVSRRLARADRREGGRQKEM